MARDDTLGVADIGEILGLLPHRYPFLLIDRVINIRGDQHGIGIKNLTVNEPFLACSAKNLAIPGVLVIEGMAQTAGVMALRSPAFRVFHVDRQGQVPQTSRPRRYARVSYR
jgi:3-hydroxyacyl-[acyl-carrier-protein] dehydratase